VIILSTAKAKKKSIQKTIRNVTKDLKFTQKVIETSSFKSGGTLTISTSDYLIMEASNTIEGKKNKEQIFLSYPNLDLMVQFIDEVLQWFNGPDYKDLYTTYKDEVIINNKYYNLHLTINDLPAGKLMTVKPTVMKEELNTAYGHEQNVIYSEAVSINFNNNIIVDILVEDLEFMRDFINDFDLYSTSLQLYNILLQKDND
jgi:hypothetical protein